MATAYNASYTGTLHRRSRSTELARGVKREGMIVTAI